MIWNNSKLEKRKGKQAIDQIYQSMCVCVCAYKQCKYRFDWLKKLIMRLVIDFYVEIGSIVKLKVVQLYS